MNNFDQIRDFLISDWRWRFFWKSYAKTVKKCHATAARFLLSLDPELKQRTFAIVKWASVVEHPISICETRGKWGEECHEGRLRSRKAEKLLHWISNLSQSRSWISKISSSRSALEQINAPHSCRPSQTIVNISFRWLLIWIFRATIGPG